MDSWFFSLIVDSLPFLILAVSVVLACAFVSYSIRSEDRRIRAAHERKSRSRFVNSDMRP